MNENVRESMLNFSNIIFKYLGAADGVFPKLVQIS